jgi:hypothetical protein
MELQLSVDGFDMGPSPESPARKARAPAILKEDLLFAAWMETITMSSMRQSAPVSVPYALPCCLPKLPLPVCKGSLQY